MKRRNITIMLLALIAFICFAQKKTPILNVKESDVCTIEYVNTDTREIKVGNGEIKTKGQCFYAGQTIHWQSKEHSLKVRNMRTGEILRFCAKEFNDEISNVASWYIKKNQTYVKGTATMHSILSNTFYMIDDTIRIKSNLLMDNNHGYIIKTIPDNNEIILPYDEETNEIVISRYFLKKHNINIQECPIKLHIEYWKYDNSQALTDNMKIEYVPEIIK